MGEAVLYTDGSSKNKTGFGGWGWHCSYDGERNQSYGGDKETTNNRMEMTAVIEGLLFLKDLPNPPDKIIVVSDSQYVIKGITEWIVGWELRGWVNSQGKPVLNRDLWEELDALQKPLNIEWHWVKGHAGNQMNEYADELAGKGRKEAEEKWMPKE